MCSRRPLTKAWRWRAPGCARLRAPPTADAVQTRFSYLRPSSLGVEIDGAALRASTHGRTVWQGDLGEGATATSGPVACVRIARLTFMIAVGPARALTLTQMPPWRPGPDAFE